MPSLDAEIANLLRYALDSANTKIKQDRCVLCGWATVNMGTPQPLCGRTPGESESKKYGIDSTRCGKHLWFSEVAQALSTSHAQGYKDGLEDAAKLAESICKHPKGNGIKCDYGDAPEVIATAIRKLEGKDA